MAATNTAKSLETKFTAYNEELERVEIFKYLGRLMSYDDNDAPAIRAQLRKGRKVWQRFSKLLRQMKASPRVAGKFYKAVVQSVLLFGSETWNITPSMTKVLEGFHVRCAWRMATENRPRRDPQTGTYTYPPSEKVLKEVGLETMTHYIKVRRDTVARFVWERPIFDLCRGVGRYIGTSAARQNWWDQPMDLEAESGDDEDGASSESESSLCICQ